MKLKKGNLHIAFGHALPIDHHKTIIEAVLTNSDNQSQTIEAIYSEHSLNYCVEHKAEFVDQLFAKMRENVDYWKLSIAHYVKIEKEIEK